MVPPVLWGRLQQVAKKAAATGADRGSAPCRAEMRPELPGGTDVPVCRAQG